MAAEGTETPNESRCWNPGLRSFRFSHKKKKEDHKRKEPNNNANSVNDGVSMGQETDS
jgi:hypothetical protein